MELKLVKPGPEHYGAYLRMMEEWEASGTRIAPWFLGMAVESPEAFAAFAKALEGYEEGVGLDPRYPRTVSWFVTDAEGTLVGAASLRLELFAETLASWGHIGYGVRPSLRNRGCATEILRLTLEEAGKRGIRRAVLGCYEDNPASARVMEHCGGVFWRTVPDPEHPDRTILQYRIDCGRGEEA